MATTPDGPGDTPPGDDDDGDDDTATSGGTHGGPSDDDGAGAGPGARPERGSQGEFADNPSPGTGESGLRRELGALAGTLPFTGLVLGLVALVGLLTLGGGMAGRWATATR